MEPLLSIQECAAVLNVPLSWFYNGSAENDGIKLVKVGKYLRVPADNFNSYLVKKGIVNG